MDVKYSHELTMFILEKSNNIAPNNTSDEYLDKYFEVMSKVSEISNAISKSKNQNNNK